MMAGAGHYRLYAMRGASVACSAVRRAQLLTAVHREAQDESPREGYAAGITGTMTNMTSGHVLK